MVTGAPCYGALPAARPTRVLILPPRLQYERARRGHTAVIRGESYKQMKLGQLVHPLLVACRELLWRLVPATVLQKSLRKTNVYEVAPYIEEFRRMRGE